MRPASNAPNAALLNLDLLDYNNILEIRTAVNYDQWFNSRNFVYRQQFSPFHF